MARFAPVHTISRVAATHASPRADTADCTRRRRTSASSVESHRSYIMTKATLLVLIAVLSVPAGAHPLSQGALDVAVHPDHVAVRARITVEEVIITEMMTAMQANAPGEGARRSLDESYPHHAGYLAQRIHISA